MTSVYTDLLKFLADSIELAYNPQTRPESLEYKGTILYYKPEKSHEYYTHYEAEDFIIVSIRGVKTFIQLLEGISKKLLPSYETSFVSIICNKFKQLEEENKQIYLVGHSLGAFSIVRCSILTGRRYKSFLFSPYVPSGSGYIFDEYMKFNYKKMYYTNDIVSNHLSLTRNKLYNTMIFENSNYFLTNHNITIYRRPPFVLNQELKRFVN